MRFTSTSLLLMSCIGAVYSQPLTSDSSTNGQPMPHRWIRYDLTEYNNTSHWNGTTSLEVRTPITVCERIISTTAACLAIANILKTWATSVGNAIKSLSDQQSCGKSYGNLDGISWVYYANGNNCDTTAEAATIIGAIEKHLKDTDGEELCGTECMDLTHGGTWNGYLLIGPTSNFDSSTYCGPTLTFKACSSGGNNDLL